MRFDVLTLFPEMFPGYLGQSLLRRAIDAGLVQVKLHNLRDWATGPHAAVDDRPFGGGPGMVLKAEPVVEAVEAVQATQENTESSGDADAPRASVGSVSCRIVVGEIAIYIALRTLRRI